MSIKEVDNLPDEFVGYENLIAFIEQEELQRLDGDIVEIGAYMGGGTVKLAKFAKRYGKKVYVIDTFDSSTDQTMSRSGVMACEVYKAFLGGRSMLDVYEEATGEFDNITTIRADSMEVQFDEDQRFFFGFIDGCHQLAYVENDFRLIWHNLVSGGAVAVHDYKYNDWPEVTLAVNHLMDQYRHEIGAVHEIEGAYGILSVLFIKK